MANMPLIYPPGLPSVTIALLPYARGGMAGQAIMEVTGPAVTVESGPDAANLRPVQLPFIVGENGVLRLSRDPAGTQASFLGVLDMQAPTPPVNATRHSGFTHVPITGALFLPPGPAVMGDAVRVYTLTRLYAALSNVKFQTTSSDGGDIDLRVYVHQNGGWTLAGSSATASATETVTIAAPADEWYATEISLYQDAGGGTSTTGTFTITL